MTGRGRLEQIVATTDVHSHLHHAASIVATLYELRGRSLVVDSGDFFQGSDIYLHGQGRLEEKVLTGLYDILAPGNHGWAHYLRAPLRRDTVCANVVDTRTRHSLFHQIRAVEIGGVRTAVTAVISPAAFVTIPPGERLGVEVLDPVDCLRALHRRHRDYLGRWVLLSHSGLEADRRIAQACPWLDVIFAGHCHSPAHGPVTAGRTVIVKGREHGGGYALARPGSYGWQVSTENFPTLASPQPDLAWSGWPAVEAELAGIATHSSTDLGGLPRPWHNATPSSRVLLGAAEAPSPG